MVVYVELAFLENFCLDLLLLALTVFAVKAPLKIGRLCFSSAVGGAFAVLFPLLSLPRILLDLLKLSIGALLPLPVVGRRRWGLGVLFFFLLAFVFGGALLGVQAIPKWGRFILFALLIGVATLAIERLYKRRALFQYVYDCTVQIGEKKARARGFLDSGNFASKEGLPVCFLSADILYDLVGYEILFKSEEGGQGCDEMQIFTQAGVKRIPLYRGILQVKGGRKEVYFAPSANRIGREYKIILHSRIMEGLCDF